MAEWEVVMDQGRLPLWRKKGAEGTSLDGQVMSEPGMKYINNWSGSLKGD